MSKGVTNETLDGINIKWFENIAQDIKSGKLKFSPTRRVMIPKPGKNELRPLSVGNPREKIVQKALTVLLESIWDDKFSKNSYGFRPGKTLKQALYQLYRNGSAYQWVIQGDISKCFDKIPHHIIMRCLETNLTCDKTLQLIRKSLTAGFIEPETGLHIKPSEPQGSVLSPLLANLVLNELDKKVESIKQSFEKGAKRGRNKEYDQITARMQWLRKSHPGSTEFKQLAVKRRSIPSMNMFDPNFKRLIYLRYADDFVILIIGSIDEAKHIKHMVADCLNKKCGLELHKDKTLITATKDGFSFLGAWCKRTNSTGLFKSYYGNPARYRMRMRIEIPMKSILAKLKMNKFIRANSKGVLLAKSRTDLVNLAHYEIITFYNHRLNGIINFYTFASNYSSLWTIIMFLRFSCALTLARKHKLRTMRKAFQKFGKDLTDPETGLGLKVPTELKHDFGGPEIRKIDESLNTSWYAKLTKSSLYKACAICKTTNQVEMHHIRKVKDVRGKIRTGDSTYAQWVGAYRRKQVPLCAYHHDLLHKGNLNYSDMTIIRNFTN